MVIYLQKNFIYFHASICTAIFDQFTASFGSALLIISSVVDIELHCFVCLNTFTEKAIGIELISSLVYFFEVGDDISGFYSVSKICIVLICIRTNEFFKEIKSPSLLRTSRLFVYFTNIITRLLSISLSVFLAQICGFL